ncbi:MAG: hypothetical protein N3A57_03100 [Negativicutes bacterium]|nr:hypothetical protein [Negativicutes bacterium]
MLWQLWRSGQVRVGYWRFCQSGLRLMIGWGAVAGGISWWWGGERWLWSLAAGWLAAVVYFLMSAGRVWLCGACRTPSQGRRVMRAGSSLVLLFLVAFLLWAVQSDAVAIIPLVAGLLSWQLVLLAEGVVVLALGVWRQSRG